MKYRKNKYLTLSGQIYELGLPNSAYGEWIVYENKKPRFHVNIFKYDAKSNCLVYLIMNESKLEFKDILTDINNRFNRMLTLSSKSKFRLKINSEPIEIDLGPIPFEFIEHYTDLIKAPWEKYPDIEPNDIFWRMGKGEDSISTFARYYNALNKDEKIDFKEKFKPSNSWAKFYE